MSSAGSTLSPSEQDVATGLRDLIDHHIARTAETYHNVRLNSVSSDLITSIANAGHCHILCRHSFSASTTWRCSWIAGPDQPLDCRTAENTISSGHIIDSITCALRASSSPETGCCHTNAGIDQPPDRKECGNITLRPT